MKKIVKYSNYMNALEFRKFNAADYDFLMFLCAELRGHETNLMTFSLTEIRTVTGYSHKGAADDFSDALRDMNRKLMSVSAEVKDNGDNVQFVLFPTFRISQESNTLTVRVNEDFKFILNEITGGFTRFELEEFTRLKSKYSKTLYRLLKQYRSTGEYYVKVEELRKLIGCPKTYENKFFMNKIIAPAVEELQTEFPLLVCEQVRSPKRGRPVVAYRFNFRPEGKDDVPGQTTLDQGVEEIRKYKQEKSKQEKRGNRFNNFTQRQYDFDELEKQLVNSQNLDDDQD